MSKTIAPLLSFGAGGQVGQTMVYSSWKGIQYVRRYVVPANPKTTRQQVTRRLFAKLQRMWLVAPDLLKAPFQLNAQGRPYTAVNKFTSLNVKGIDTSAPPTDMDFFQGSPGAKGGLPPVSLALTPGSGTITAALGAPTVPSDWTIVQAVAVAFNEQDPQVDFIGNIYSGFDASSPYQVALTGLPHTTEMVVSAWFQWLRPDGTTAYSTSLTDTATTT